MEFGQLKTKNKMTKSHKNPVGVMERVCLDKPSKNVISKSVCFLYFGDYNFANFQMVLLDFHWLFCKSP